MSESKFLAALKRKYRTPQDALRALGLDEDILDEDEPDPKKVVIAHDEAFAAPNPSNRSTRVNTAEYKLLNAMRARYQTLAKPMRLLGLDQADLDAASGEPDDGGDMQALLAQFRQLTDEDKSSFLQAISDMADENDDETPGDAARRRFAQDRGLLPYHHRAGSPSAFAQRLTRRIGNGFG